jgi:hypothetical protein
MTREASPFGKDGPLPAEQFKFSAVSAAARSVVAFLELDLGPPAGPAFFGVRWDPIYPDPNTGEYRYFNIPPDQVLIDVGEIPVEWSLSPLNLPQPGK